MVNIDDEVSPAGAGQRIPANPRSAVFEVIGAGRPNQEGHGLIGLLDDLEPRVAHGLEVAQEVLALKPLGNGVALRKVASGTNRELRCGNDRGFIA